MIVIQIRTSSENWPEYSLLITTTLIRLVIDHAGASLATNDSTDCSPFLLARKHAIRSWISSGFCGTICNRHWHRASRMFKLIYFFNFGSGQPSNCSTRLRFSFEVDSVSGLLKYGDTIK
ncbi:hypothetical protein CEXT_326511 [Caerostris extrusa]|uniref:Uncharacterized protein n=1 Tax=Caerostris extrusa TaxID=172846 RepID=A0AAV4XCX0_CAEEX|nr:hypothetical protein CEXT_326511 [Caerostris extrusa]